MTKENSDGGKRAFEAAECEEVKDFDKVKVEIWGYQYKAFKRASEILVGLGADDDDTPEHIMREFALEDDASEIVELFLSGVEMQAEKLDAMKAAWEAQRDKLTA
jgi:hypothetical protein